MSGEEEEYKECVNGLLDEFSTYDQYVDVVSCWEEFLTTQYKPHFENFFFDRFPTMHKVGEGDPVTPDFSVYFNDKYGIVFEVSRTMPTDDELFSQELDQIRNYDADLQFKTGDNPSRIPEIQDIVLLISTTDSQTIEHKIANKIDSGELDLESNLILMDYTYLDQDRTPNYQFRRLSNVDQNFRDGELPETMRLSTKLSMEGGQFESIYSPPDSFYDYKATGVICNDRPPDLYLCCYMWQSVFSDYLDDEDLKIWQRKNPNSIIPLEIDPNDLKEKLNEDYIPDGSVRVEWVRSALEFFIIAGVADVIDHDLYRIKFRNLRDKRRKFDEVVTARSKISDLAHLFAEWHCESFVEIGEDELSALLEPEPASPEPEVEDPYEVKGQTGLTDFQ